MPVTKPKAFTANRIKKLLADAVRGATELDEGLKRVMFRG